jgi:hypothetical protein
MPVTALAERGSRGAMPWRVRVLAALAGFPDGTTVSRLTRPLAGGAHDYDSMYDRIYQVLRACERRGYVRRAGFLERRVAGSWDAPDGAWLGRGLVSWQVTTAGADYLSAWEGRAIPAGGDGR